jgi:hypothetical protein
MDCNGAVNTDDINPFALALTDLAQYAAQYPQCDAQRADINEDSLTNGEDVQFFVDLLLSR